MLVSLCFAQQPAVQTLIEQNKDIARRAIAAFNARDFAAVDALFAEHFVNHAIASQPIESRPDGPEATKAVIRMIESAFPDFKMEILDLVAEGERVAFRTAFTGTHDGPYMGIPATGKNVSSEAIHILRISGGKVVEHWSVRDDLTRLRQIGQLPPVKQKTGHRR